MADQEQDQEAVLERLLTRLALTDDSKLESVLTKLLPYAISCLESPRPGIKQKVMEMLTHINKRVKDQPSIKLPLLELLKLYQKEKAAPMVKSFSLVYMEMAFDRGSKDEEDLAPALLENISKASPQHQDILLRMAAKDLEKYALENIDENFIAKCTFIKTSVDRDIFLDFCLQTMMYQPISPEGSTPAPPGLSKLQVLRVSGKSNLNREVLVNRKIALLNVVGKLEMPTEAFYPLLLAASVDSAESVQNKSEELLKRKASNVNLEHPILVKKLYSIFQGTHGNDIPADARVSPASPPLKIKLMSVFTRSVAAANSFPLTLHCIFDCLYGNDSFLRLKQSGMDFTVWVFKHARDEQMKPMAPIILSGMLKLLDNPPPREADTSAKSLRMFAYQAIGQLGQRAPHLFRDNIDIVIRLFEAFKVEPQSLKFTIQEAITSLASAYEGCSDLLAREIDSLLLRYISEVQDEARFCSVWWAKNLYKFNHCASRFICMVGASDERLDIRDMALEGLDLSKQRGSAESDYPALSDMLDFICTQQPNLLIKPVLGEKELLFRCKTYEVMIEFLLKCCNKHEGCLPLYERFLLILEHGMASNGSSLLHSKASNGLLVLASKSPEKFAEIYAARVKWLIQFLGHIDITTRENVARLLGIVSSELSTSATVTLLEDLRLVFNVKKKNRFEDIHGAICATGYILAQCMTGKPTVSPQTIEAVLSDLIELGISGNDVLSGSVVEAIGHIGLRGQLPVYHKLDSSKDEEVPTSVAQLFKHVMTLKESKALPKAVIAYGHMCYGNPEKGLVEEALSAIFTLSRTKVEEVLFAVGEALCFIWGGLSLTADEILKTTFVSLSSTHNFLSDNDMEINGSEMKTLPSSGISDDERATARELIVTKLFDELLYSSRKEERCSGAVWLVSIITYCGSHPRIYEMLPDIQEALTHLLGDQNELTQEMASKGLSIVYELGDANARHELVKALVNTLSGTGKRKRAIKLTEDSEVFEEGALGEKPGGGKITTYKELCSLANEMGQPDLIYKFMDLANHQASLNSKRGAAFGFAKIAKRARDALTPYIPSLVPKLLRYQYDPNKLVQDAMGYIWRSIVIEPKKTVDEYFDAIMEDLIFQAGSKLWRSREASCLALADLLQGRRFEEVGKHLEQIWIACFRAMDDIKETVRNAGLGLGRSVSSLTLRLGNIQLSDEASARATAETVLPILLSKGIMSNVPDVQRLSISTVMKLVKSAGSSIRPLLPDLVVSMLESLSSLEDQRLNYAELHAERVGINTEKLESIRVSLARDSPMWDTLDFCLQQVDAVTLEVLVPRLLQLVRSGVGLNTRVGLAKFISLLAQQVGSDLKKYTGALLKILKTAAQEEKSPSSRRAFVTACATVAKYSSPAQIQSLFEDIVILFNTGTANAQIASGLLLKELSLQASDVFSGYCATVLPIAYIASFEDDKVISNLFEEIWEENTSGQSTSFQLYASDIIPLAVEGLSSTSWTQKKKSAKALSKIAEAANDVLNPYVETLLKSLLQELSGRLWDGKEVLLDALSAICKGCGTCVPQSSTSVDVITQRAVVVAIISACKKKKLVYRNAAFSCLEQALLHFNDQYLFKDVLPFLLECCLVSAPKNTPHQDDAKDEDAVESYVSSLEKVLVCLKASFLTAPPPEICDQADTILGVLEGHIKGNYSWQVKLAAVNVVPSIAKFAEVKDSNIVKRITSVIFSILDCLCNVKVGQVRIACLECLLTLVRLAGTLDKFDAGTREHLSSLLVSLYQSEKDGSAKSLLQEVLSHVQSTNVKNSCPVP